MGVQKSNRRSLLRNQQQLKELGLIGSHRSLGEIPLHRAVAADEIDADGEPLWSEYSITFDPPPHEPGMLERTLIADWGEDYLEAIEEERRRRG